MHLLMKYPVSRNFLCGILLIVYGTDNFVACVLHAENGEKQLRLNEFVA